VRYTTSDGAQFLIEALRSLDAEKLAPATLTVREPSLDDVFLSLTGHRAEPTDGQEQPAEGTRRRRGAA
jgi:ABC-2 type transport system ATP-binding protein